MKNLAVMKGDINNKIAQARGIIAKADIEKRGLSADEKSAADALTNEVRLLQGELDAETERQAEENRSATGPGVGADGAVAAAVSTVTDQERSYRSLFNGGRTAVNNGGFKTFGEFLQVVSSRKYDPRLEERQHVTNPGALGGFTVPETWAEFLADKSLEAEIVRPRAKLYPMPNGDLHIPRWANNDHTAGIYGGLNGVWVDELGVNVDQEGTLERVTLHKNKLAIYSSVSNELLHDSPSFERELGQALVRGVGHYLDQAFISGTGGAEPLGALNDPAAIDVARAGAGNVIYTDLITMFSALHKGIGTPTWLVSPDVLPDLLQMESPGNDYIWQANAREEVAGKLFGYPVIVTEKVPALGNRGDVMLVNWSHYAVGLGPDIRLEQNNAPGWAQDFTSYRCIVRADGCGTWSAPFTTANGSVLSWCVVLDA